MKEEMDSQRVISCGDVDNLGLKHGERANVELVASNERFWGEVVGIKTGYFLSIWLPSLRERNYKDLLTDYPDVVVRAKCDGCYLCGFKTTVIKVMNYPYPLLYLAYPRAFEKVNLRKSKRVECFQPVYVKSGTKEHYGIFRDLSFGGGRIEFTFAKDEVSVFAEGAEVEFRFDYEKNGTRISGCGIVKSILRGGNRTSIGFEFVALPNDERAELEKIISDFDLLE